MQHYLWSMTAETRSSWVLVDKKQMTVICLAKAIQLTAVFVSGTFTFLWGRCRWRPILFSLHIWSLLKLNCIIGPVEFDFHVWRVYIYLYLIIMSNFSDSEFLMWPTEISTQVLKCVLGEKRVQCENVPSATFVFVIYVQTHAGF